MSTKKYIYDLNFLELYEKINKIKPFKKAKELAEILGVSPQMITSFKKGRRKVPIGLLINFAFKNSLSVDYLLGIVSAEKGTGQKEGLVEEAEVREASRGYGVVISHLSVTPLLEGEVERVLLELKKSWLETEFPQDREFMSVLCVDSDNMTPTLNQNDLLLVNRKLNSFSGAGIYAIRQGDVILIRRVFVGIDGSYTFKNDNEAYPPEKVTAPMLESMKMEVLGRVVWKGKKL